MRHLTLALLPGLDGTGALFGPVREIIPDSLLTRVISYATDQALGYAALLPVLEAQLANEDELVLIAESFSGPLALRYAAAHPDRVRAVVLCASFICSPLPRWLRYLVTPGLFWISPPTFAVKRLLVGRDAAASLVQAVKAAIGRVKPGVLARRLREVFNVDCSDALRKCPAPILYLIGAQDALVRRSTIESIVAANPNVTVQKIDGPHLLLQSRQQPSWDAIRQFLTRTHAWSTDANEQRRSGASGES